jgi:signal peptidase I
MVPTINVGDIVLMKETTAVDLDDIVVYKAGNIYITHRLIQIIDENYITKGDANRSSEMIKKTQVVGKIVSKSRVFGKLIKLLREPLILLILYAAWLLIIVIDNNLKKNKQIEAVNSFVNPTSELLENLYNNNIPIIQQKETKKYVDLSDYIIKK